MARAVSISPRQSGSLALSRWAHLGQSAGRAKSSEACVPDPSFLPPRPHGGELRSEPWESDATACN
eukprot:9494387-Pyramimonas_sp.AAC.1